MRDDICTIPVSEVFEVNDGCPLCRMERIVEERILNYILGDAMMEPDVRIETNKVGFCLHHFDKMYNRRGRLQLALMLETHIKETEKNIFDKKLFSSAGKKAARVKKLSESCFICNKMEWGLSRMLDTIYRCYEAQSDFRDMFNNQPMFCLKHYERLVDNLEKSKCPKHHKELVDNLTRITCKYLESLSGDISKYCTMYDYRSKGDDFGTSRDAVERCIDFLCSSDYSK